MSPRGCLYNIASVINDAVFYTLKHVKSVLIKEQTNIQTKYKKTRKFWEVIEMISTLVVVMVPWVHLQVQTLQYIYINCSQLLIINYTSVKL